MTSISPTASTLIENMASPGKLNKISSMESNHDCLMDIMDSLTTQKRQLAKDDEADFVLQFEQAYIIVSARIMSDASPVFKDWLLSDSSNQAPRSATRPQWREMENDVSAVHMKFLCALLHGYHLSSDYPGTDEQAVLSFLDGVAILAKMYRAVECLSDDISPRLLQPFAKRAPQPARGQEQRSFDRDVQLARVACLLEHQAMYSLFTRRMILDHCIPLSSVDPSTAAVFEPLLLRKFE